MSESLDFVSGFSAHDRLLLAASRQEKKTSPLPELTKAFSNWSCLVSKPFGFATLFRLSGWTSTSSH